MSWCDAGLEKFGTVGLLKRVLLAATVRASEEMSSAVVTMQRVEKIVRSVAVQAAE